MEETTWDQRLNALTYLLINPTTRPSFHSQILISSQIPCYLNWDYPPILCKKPSKFFPSLHLQWAFSQFLKRASRFDLPLTSWRSKCPYQQPPPLVLAKGVEEAQWGDEEKRMFVRRRFSRKRLGSNVNPLVPIIVPNLLLLCLMFWDPSLDYMD